MGGLKRLARVYFFVALAVFNFCFRLSVKVGRCLNFADACLKVTTACLIKMYGYLNFTDAYLKKQDKSLNFAYDYLINAKRFLQSMVWKNLSVVAYLKIILA